MNEIVELKLVLDHLCLLKLAHELAQAVLLSLAGRKFHLTGEFVVILPCMILC